MRVKLLISLLFFFSINASAVVCKSVGADGEVSYSDVPAGECNQEIKLPDYSRYAPRKFQENAFTRGLSTPDVENKANMISYESLSIISPEDNATVRENTGKVSVVVDVQPGLAGNHLIRMYMDGNKVGEDLNGRSFSLTNVDRGTHSLKAAVVDASGKQLIESQSVKFTMRRYSAAASKIGLPTPATSSVTSGATNPSFAPNY